MRLLACCIATADAVTAHTVALLDKFVQFGQAVDVAEALLR